jgi:thiol-disulfide isomerase/thioredoxin
MGNPGLKAAYLTDEEWNRIRSARRASVFESVGDVYIKLNSLDSAAKYYLSALQASVGNSQPELYVKLLDIYERQAKYNDALKVSEHAIVYSESNTDIDASNKKSYVKVKGSDQGYDDYFAGLQKQAKERRMQKLRSNMLDITPELGYVETVDGLSVDMRAFKGNVIVIYFWSTWCEPCQEQIKALDSLREKYSTRQDVVFLPVDVWENVSNKSQEIKSFVKETGIQLPVYTDSKDILPQKFGVTGLPTTIFIDKSGRIRFKESGFENDDTVIRDIDDRLDLILNEKL